MNEDLPFGSRGGIAVHYNFPADGEYDIKIRLTRDGDRANGDGGTVRGVGLKRQLEIRLDDARVKAFTVGGERFEKKAQQEEFEQHGVDANLNTRSRRRPGRTSSESHSASRILPNLKV